MTTTPTSGAAIQRYKIGYHSDEWGQRSSTPSGIPDASGSWVRYADHVTALAAGQATAAQAVVPAGWKLVPEQPTLPMLIKGSDTDTSTSVEDCRRVYRAMLAAAPAQPVAQHGAAYAAQQASTVTNYTTLGAAMRAIRQSIQMIGDPEDECMRAVKRVLRGAVIIVEDSGDEVAAPAAPAQPAAQQGVAYAAQPEPADIIAGALQISRGHAYELMREAVATDASHWQAPAEPEGISREDWIEQAVRVYLIAGDTDEQAQECAAYLWGELDMDDLADPYDAAMSDIEGRNMPRKETQ